MFQLRQVTKRFGAIQAVDGISFSVARGETLGLLGPNGAGKTTTVSMIAGLLRPDAGEVEVKGQVLTGDTDSLKHLIGYVPQDLALFEPLSARENLATIGALYGLHGQGLSRAIDEKLAWVGLADRAKDRVQTFSGGMKRRLNLAAALLHEPELIILDEPTVGVDPQSRNAIFESLEGLKKAGATLIYTTHYMEEAERLCDRIVIIDHGRVLKDGTLGDLQAELPVATVLKVVCAGGNRDLVTDLQGLEGVVTVAREGDAYLIGLTQLGSGSAAVLAWLAAQGVDVRQVSSDRATLETVFLNLTGRTLRDA